MWVPLAPFSYPSVTPKRKHVLVTRFGLRKDASPRHLSSNSTRSRCPTSFNWVHWVVSKPFMLVSSRTLPFKFSYLPEKRDSRTPTTIMDSIIVNFANARHGRIVEQLQKISHLILFSSIPRFTRNISWISNPYILKIFSENLWFRLLLLRLLSGQISSILHGPQIFLRNVYEGMVRKRGEYFFIHRFLMDYLTL